ncbi:MAG: hypothetical protein J3R72DRAFT_450197 [Linnemannia gamsii]|nr:MAG: hypothetical protein J3R72DRAFT_450197 [Linnemannia gamsii]
MSDRSWSPPLDVDTRTLKSVSIIRARPEHLPSIHKIQLLAYPGRLDFHETEEVFRSKLEAYPAGNFVALATYSVVTHDDTSTWDGKEAGEEEEEVEEEGFVHGISVVEITETGADGASTTTTTTTTLGNDGNETHHVDIVRARTPDISEGTDDEDDVSSHKWSTGLDVPHAATRHGHRQDSKVGEHHHTATSSDASTTAAKAAAAAGPEADDEEDTTILFQWEEPVGYLFSHPYSRESVTLHRMGAGLAHEGKVEAQSTDASSKPKRIRLDGGGSGSGAEASSKEHHEEEEEEEEEENDTMFDHDQWMEKYYVHDCAIHPGWRGQGLASKLWKALEESLTPARDSEVHGGVDGAASGASGEMVDTEEEEEDNEGHDESAPEDDKTTSTSTTRRRRGRRGSKKSHGGSHKHSGRSRRKGAPNLKEIVLVSVQGTKPFWQRAGGFQVVTDHDMDLSVYGDEAFLMHKTFVF